MIGVIDNYNFEEMEPQKYWSPPSSWSDEKKRETTRNRIFSDEWLGAEKKDGYFTKIVKDDDGNVFLFSRSRGVNGKFPNKVEWVPHLHSFFESLPNGTCLLGELYLPSKPGSSNITTLLGCLKDKCIARQEKGEKLHLYIFDILAYQGKSFLKMNATYRFNYISELSTFAQYKSEFVDWAIYLSGKELWFTLQSILADGKEGIVLTRNGSCYQPGKRPSKDCQKVKKELQDNVDCFFTGKINPATREYSGKEIETWKYWINLYTDERIEGEKYDEYMKGAALQPVTKPYFHNWAGSLEIGVLKDGKVVPIGYLSSLADEIKANWKDYAGKCIEVAAMQFTDDGALRHAKMIRFRPDLTIQDCTWEKLYGE